MENMELTSEEKELILKKRKEERSSKKFNSIYRKVEKIAKERVEEVKSMGIDLAIRAEYGEDGVSPLVMIYTESKPYLHSYQYKKEGYGFTKEQFQKLDKLYAKYSQIANEVFRDLLEEGFSVELSKLSENAKDAIFSKSWEDGHSCGYQEVFYHYESNVEFVLECIG